MTSTLDDDFLPTEQPGRLGREELREDVPAALRYAAILVVVGLPLGALWALLAPVVHVVALPGAGTGSPAGEADHAFDAVAIHVLLVAAFGVVAGAVAWRRRHRRGPVMLVALVLGTLVGGWVAGRVGALLAWSASPVPVLVDPSALGTSGAPGAPLPAVLTSLPPSPGPWWIALIAGLGGALAYVLAAIVDGHEDMSRDDAAGSGAVPSSGA